MEKESKIRYSVNLNLRGIGEEGQKRLFSSTLLIIGAGALGATAGMYAAASGIGNIIIVDFDTVDVSNLQRQVFYKTSDAGKKKGMLLAKSIRDLNPDCNVNFIDGFYNERNAVEITEKSDFIIDAADNPSATYLIEKTAGLLNIGYVTAGVGGYRAQIFTHLPGQLHFSDVVTPVDDTLDMLPCSIEGVFGPLTGLVASMEASEAVKYLAGMNATQQSLIHINLLDNTFQKLIL